MLYLVKTCSNKKEENIKLQFFWFIVLVHVLQQEQA